MSRLRKLVGFIVVASFLQSASAIGDAPASLTNDSIVQMVLWDIDADAIVGLSIGTRLTLTSHPQQLQL